MTPEVIREKRLLLAYLAGGLAKIGGVALQVVAIPLVLRKLGADRFAIFTLISSALGLLSFAQLGLAPYLTQKVSSLLAQRKAEQIGRYLWSASGIVLGVGLCGACCAVILASVLGLNWLWGPAADQFGAVLNWGFRFAMVIGIVTLVGSIFLGCQAGYQEMHFGSVAMGVGNLVTALVVAILCRLEFVGERSLWLGFYGIPAGALAVACVHFIRRHPALSPSKGDLDPSLFPELFFSGGKYMMAQLLLPFIFREGFRLYLLNMSSLSEVALYALLLQMSGILGGVVVIFTQPLYGPLGDAWIRRDYSWATRRLRLLRLWFSAFGVSGIILAALFGVRVVELWVGRGVTVGPAVMVIFAVSFWVASLIHIHQIFLTAQGRLGPLLRVSIAEILTQIALVLVFRPKSTQGVFTIIVASQMVLSLPLSWRAITRPERCERCR